MFAESKWGDEEYRAALETLVKKDTELVAEVTRIIKERHGWEKTKARGLPWG